MSRAGLDRVTWFVGRPWSDVIVRGRAGLSCRRGIRTTRIDSELLASDEVMLVVFRDSIRRWDPPFGWWPVTQRDVERIIADIRSLIREHQRAETRVD